MAAKGKQVRQRGDRGKLTIEQVVGKWGGSEEVSPEKLSRGAQGCVYLMTVMMCLMLMLHVAN